MTLHSTLKNLDLEHGTFILTGASNRTLYRMSDADAELIIQTMVEAGCVVPQEKPWGPLGDAILNMQDVEEIEG